MLKVGINGLGRIGRCLFRLLCDQKIGSNIELVAVNGSSDIALHRHLLVNDSVHGRFEHEIEKVGNDHLYTCGKKIKYFCERDPENIPWKSCGVDVVFECTGKFNKRALSAKHIRGSVKKVIVSAPVEDADIQVIYGINEHDIKSGHEVVSVGSCTTNCAAHIVGTMNSAFGIEGGFITTVHSYTNDQNHVDGSHKDFRRSRACALSMIPTTTGASKALTYLFPNLAGKISASAIRVPTPNVSVVDFTFVPTVKVTRDAVNEAFISAANAHKSILLATWELCVSVDFNHTSYSAVFDLSETYVSESNFARVLGWYDNEWAFANRMIDVAIVAGRSL
ncbi:type I glyceraldehyde-3-phosphate dehydrogenase [Candidatus Anaplasma sp. TIGMIC]|uniref:type I glyceraldehyde-3-phosphate dehydrogenase n=1 Tax=Candidatus Anaplasma sp. TIGMIC TaxID=3020713 RepID=UPI00232E753A|nr:type I glyceraldehyde-3-phosphate dehydrogenase [Candidatus Anaplasma sp. TIGMIC]MDB1135658.1 type I glyceraldehyde-3-phosphate dehydrogenase [Candidatus Anaplasma sp. TIGMIC]